MAKTPNYDLPSFSIRCNGVSIPDTFAVISIWMHHGCNQIPYCQIEIQDYDPTTHSFPVSNSDVFELGVQIEVLFGYESNIKTVFKGTVVEQSLQSTDFSSLVLQVKCMANAFKMDTTPKNARYTKLSDSAILSNIIQEYQLIPDVQATNSIVNELLQNQTSDWDFLLERAEANGLVVLVDDNTIHVKEVPGAQQAAISCTFGNDIFEFRTAVSLDPGDSKKQKSSKPSGMVVLQGTYVKPGDWIDVKDLGKRFSGPAFISKVTQKMEAGTWKTTVYFGSPFD
jgi:phage protein D